LQELGGEREAAQRKKASAELDVADLEDKLAGNASERGSRARQLRAVCMPVLWT
jgi:hypothetical protein